MSDIPFFVYTLTDKHTLDDYSRESDRLPSVETLNIRSRQKAQSYDPYLPDYIYNNRYEFERQQFEHRRLEHNSRSKNLSSYLISGLKELTNRYLCNINNHLYVKKEMFEEWMDVMKLFPPLLICAAYFLDDFKNTKDKSEFLNTVLRKQFSETAQRIPYVFELENLVQNDSRLLDAHTHLNGSTETDIIWWSQIGSVEKWIRSFNQKYYKDEKVFRQYEQEDLNPLKFSTILRDGKKLIEDIASEVLKNDPVFKNSWKLYYNYEDYPVLVKAAYFYLLILENIEERNDYLAAKFHHLVLIQSYLHRMIVQQKTQKGFTQFQMIPNNDIRRRHESKDYSGRFNQLMHNSDFCFLEYLEGRFAPMDKKIDDIRQINTIVEGFNNIQKDIIKKHNVTAKLGLIAHFIKKTDDSNPKEMRHRNLRKDISNKAIALVSAQHYLDFNNGIRVAGIDAAANEMDAGPEVFAPAFRWIKKHLKEPKELRQTFHAGEDFVHILSGLRMIYEAVEFLDMTQGDRIGHGTAAGIEPALWSERVGSHIYIKKGEWLDNLILVYKWISDYSCPYDNLKSKIPFIADEIYRYISDIYGRCYSIEDLYRSWTFRQYDPSFYLKNDNVYIKDDFTLRIEVDNQLKKFRNAKLLYKLYHYNIQTKSNYNSYIKIPIENGLFTTEELYQIQNLVLNHIARKGIALEVPISSNLCISFYKNLNEHHIGRWMKGKSDYNLLIPAIVMGTDDPGIFMTNIYIEYARLMTYLENKGYNIYERIETILKLNRVCRYYSFDKLETPFPLISKQKDEVLMHNHIAYRTDTSI